MISYTGGKGHIPQRKILAIAMLSSWENENLFIFFQ
jgi:hypothetical protein